MIINSRIDLAESLRRGYPVQPDRNGRVTVTIPDDIGEDERKLIADHLYQSDGLTIATPTIAPELPEPTVAGVIEVIRAHRAAAAAERERELSVRASARAKADAEMAAVMAARPIRSRDERVSYHDDGETASTTYVHVEPAMPYVADCYTDDGNTYRPEEHLSPALQAAFLAWREDLRAANVAAREAAEQEVRRQVTERLAERERIAAERAAWIAAHGSRRLQRLAAEGIEHEAVYRDERLAIDRPGWQWEPRALHLSEPRNPPEAALDLLDAPRSSSRSRHARPQTERSTPRKVRRAGRSRGVTAMVMAGESVDADQAE